MKNWGTIIILLVIVIILGGLFMLRKSGLLSFNNSTPSTNSSSVSDNFNPNLKENEMGSTPNVKEVVNSIEASK